VKGCGAVIGTLITLLLVGLTLGFGWELGERLAHLL